MTPAHAPWSVGRAPARSAAHRSPAATSGLQRDHATCVLWTPCAMPEPHARGSVPTVVDPRTVVRTRPRPPTAQAQDPGLPSSRAAPPHTRSDIYDRARQGPERAAFCRGRAAPAAPQPSGRRRDASEPRLPGRALAARPRARHRALLCSTPQPSLRTTRVLLCNPRATAVLGGGAAAVLAAGAAMSRLPHCQAGQQPLNVPKLNGKRTHWLDRFGSSRIQRAHAPLEG